MLDPSQVWAGPTCTKILGDLGADVIKVESARRMDIARGLAHNPSEGGGIYPQNDPGPDPWNRDGKYADRNRSKRSICLDLTHRRGIDAFKRIAARSDVVIENFRQGVMARFGLAYPDLRAVRPDIIMVTMGSQGATGPESRYGSFGVTLEQTAGVASITGYRGGNPSTSGVLFPDPLVAVVSVGFILAALHQRRQSGEGVYIDLSQRRDDDLDPGRDGDGLHDERPQGPTGGEPPPALRAAGRLPLPGRGHVARGPAAKTTRTGPAWPLPSAGRSWPGSPATRRRRAGASTTMSSTA